MSVIKFEPKYNHFVAKEYAAQIAKQIRKVTGIAGIIDYQFASAHTNMCSFSVRYVYDNPAFVLGPQVYCGVPSDISVVAMLSEIAINHILTLVDIIYKQAPQMDIYQLTDVLNQICGEAVEDVDVLHQFLLNSLTGRYQHDT